MARCKYGDLVTPLGKALGEQLRIECQSRWMRIIVEQDNKDSQSLARFAMAVFRCQDSCFPLAAGQTQYNITVDLQAKRNDDQ